jgi:hypothetical protein
MSSLRKILSSRANGTKSRGPVTPEGKRASARNAIRHGLLAETVVLSNESREKFEALLQAYKEKFQPRDEVESDLVEEMVVAKWRQQRLWAIEAAAIDFRMERQRRETKEIKSTDEPTRSALAFTGVEAGEKSMSLFLRYEGRMRRNYKRALADFHMICDTESGLNEPIPISEQ